MLQKGKFPTLSRLHESKTLPWRNGDFKAYSLCIIKEAGTPINTRVITLNRHREDPTFPFLLRRHLASSPFGVGHDRAFGQCCALHFLLLLLLILELDSSRRSCGMNRGKRCVSDFYFERRDHISCTSEQGKVEYLEGKGRPKKSNLWADSYTWDNATLHLFHAAADPSANN